MISKSARPVVGIRIPRWAGFTREVFAGVVDHMREHTRWRIETPLDVTSEMAPVRIDEDWAGDGLLVFRYTPEEAEAWLNRGIKVVNFSSECLDPRIPTITPDNVECGRLAAQHLIHLGIRHFAYWGDPDRTYSNERRQGFVDELARNGFECRIHGVVTHSMNELEKADRLAMAMDRAMRTLPKHTGLFAKDDLAALELTQSCVRVGLSIPEDIALIGCNDDYVFCYTADAPLSSVRYPGRLIGYKLAERLSALMKVGQLPAPRELVPSSGVVARESTGVQLYTHPHVREALKIIREEAPKAPLHVAELLERMPSSKAALQRRFLKETGETLKEAIDRVRVDKVRDLLARTPLPVKVIAEEMAFESQEELSRFFRRMTGTAPSEYRRRHRASEEAMPREEES